MILEALRRTATELEDDWTFLQGLIDEDYHRVWTSTPTLSTADMVNALLMGNGDMAVCIGGNDNTQTYYIRKSDF